MLRKILLFLLLFVILLFGYGVLRFTGSPRTELVEPPPAAEGGAATTGEGPGEQAPEPTLTPEPTPTPAPTPTPLAFLEQLSTDRSFGEGRSEARKPLRRHGLIIAFVLPLFMFGVPWLFLEIFIIRYIQPRGLDLTTLLIKAQDGLFIEATLSMTARRTLTLASTRMTWPRVQSFVEKTVEQELVHEALNFPTLDDLERNLKNIAEKFLDLSIIHELSRDFGVEVLRFNVETRYPPETMDALKRRADASAGGTAYLAYAAAAHLDPDAPESRELYKIFQQTSSQVDAARNLGSGISSLANLLGQSRKAQERGTGEDGADE